MKAKKMVSISNIKIPYNALLVSNLVSQIYAGVGTPGQLLELLAVYIVSTLPGLEVINLGLVAGGQVDVLVRNTAPLGQPLRWLDDYLLVECKDWDYRIPEKEFGHFLTKMVLNKAKRGLIISRRGLSGGPGYAYASRDQKIAYSQSEVVVLDITLDEIAVLSNASDLLELLQSKYEELRFNK